MGTILILDSSAVTCHTVSKQLRMYGFDTIPARSIADARMALALRPVDLLIHDLAAPNAGGMTLLRELRRDGALQKVPVIILTSSARDSDRIDARAAGAVAFLTKPVSTRELLFTVSSALALHAPALHPGAARQTERGTGSAAARFAQRRDLYPEWASAPLQAIG